jgi:hypothetical protein
MLMREAAEWSSLATGSGPSGRLLRKRGRVPQDQFHDAAVRRSGARELAEYQLEMTLAAEDGQDHSAR